MPSRTKIRNLTAKFDNRGLTLELDGRPIEGPSPLATIWTELSALDISVALSEAMVTVERLTRPGQVYTALKAWVEQQRDLVGPDAHVYSQREWLDRSEPFGNESLASMTFEGPFYEVMNDNAGPKLYRDFVQFLDSLNCWHELGYAWSLHVYPK